MLILSAHVIAAAFLLAAALAGCTGPKRAAAEPPAAPLVA